MNDRDVGAIVHRVIVDRGLGLEILAIGASASGWEIRLRERIGGAVATISIPDGRPIAIRVAVEEQLDA